LAPTDTKNINDQITVRCACGSFIPDGRSPSRPGLAVHGRSVLTGI
jgi:hypothetical protein